MALFLAIAGVTALFDIYFEKNPVNLGQAGATANQPAGGQAALYFYSPANSLNTASLVQKAPIRFIHNRVHDKFLQKHHQLRNFHILKAEPGRQKIPLVLSYHFIVFRDYYAPSPDDAPHIS